MGPNLLMKRYGGKIIRRIPQFLPRRQRRSPDGAQRNPALKLTQLRPPIALRSIRATKVTSPSSVICEFSPCCTAITTRCSENYPALAGQICSIWGQRALHPQVALWIGGKGIPALLAAEQIEPLS